LIDYLDKEYKLGLNINKNSCMFCNKTFCKKYGLNRHLNTCKTKNDVVEKLKNENEILKKQNTGKQKIIMKIM
jgi:hypothetical protein